MAVSYLLLEALYGVTSVHNLNNKSGICEDSQPSHPVLNMRVHEWSESMAKPILNKTVLTTVKPGPVGLHWEYNSLAFLTKTFNANQVTGQW